MGETKEYEAYGSLKTRSYPAITSGCEEKPLTTYSRPAAMLADLIPKEHFGRRLACINWGLDRTTVSNGHYLVMVPNPPPALEEETKTLASHHQRNICSATAQAIKKLFKKSTKEIELCPCAFVSDEVQRDYCIEDEQTGTSLELRYTLDTTYPDINGVIKGTDKYSYLASFAPAYLEKLGAYGRKIGSDCVSISYQDDKAPIMLRYYPAHDVHAEPLATALLMPMKGPDSGTNTVTHNLKQKNQQLLDERDHWEGRYTALQIESKQQKEQGDEQTTTIGELSVEIIAQAKRIKELDHTCVIHNEMIAALRGKHVPGLLVEQANKIQEQEDRIKELERILRGFEQELDIAVVRNSLKAKSNS
jgi:hypothetical protein